MDLAMVPKKLLHPSPSSCRHHNSPAPTGMAKHFCKAVWVCFRNPRKEGLRGGCCLHMWTHKYAKEGSRKILQTLLPHPLKHIQPIKIISVKINFDHMKVCVGKTWWFKICCVLEKIIQTHAWTHTYEGEKSQYLCLIYFDALEGTNFTYILRLLEPGKTGVVGFLLLPASTCIGLCCCPTSCQRLDLHV